MQWHYVLGLAYSIVLASIYGLGQLSPEFMLVFSNILFPATAGIAVLGSVWTLLKYTGHNPKPMFSTAWMGFSVGFFFWFLGELTWTIYVLLLQIDPFPSFADVAYLSGYVFLFVALFSVFRLFQSSFSKRMLLTMLGVTGALSAVVSYVLLVPVFASSEDQLTIILSTAYPILDIGLFAAAFSILLIFFKGTIGKAWLFLTSGIILNIAADLLFNYAELQGFYYEGHPLELFWLWGYVAFLVGFYIHKREL